MREALITILNSRSEITIETGGFQLCRNKDEFVVGPWDEFKEEVPSIRFETYDNAEQAVEAFLMCFDL
jgi:hypothetical protein